MVRIANKIEHVNLAAIYLVNRSYGPIYLEAEVANHKRKVFVSDYNSWSRGSSTWRDLTRNGHVIDCGSGKWGIEYRIYFRKEQLIKNQLERYGCTVENGDVRHSGTFRVNSKEFFKELVVKHGFIIGENY
jgi:hypothetical protein